MKRDSKKLNFLNLFLDKAPLFNRKVRKPARKHVPLISWHCVRHQPQSNGKRHQLLTHQLLGCPLIAVLCKANVQKRISLLKLLRQFVQHCGNKLSFLLKAFCIQCIYIYNAIHLYIVILILALCKKAIHEYIPNMLIQLTFRY